MKTQHSFLKLARVQQVTGTMYCAGLDPHPFGGLDASLDVYHNALSEEDKNGFWMPAFSTYMELVKLTLDNQNDPNGFVKTLTSVEAYLRKVIKILITKCNIRVFKPQAAFYEQFGLAGTLMLSRITRYIRSFEEEYGDTVIMIDCKRGDIFTTQSAYLLAFLGDLTYGWGIDYTPFDFDIMNVTPWMGRDVMVLEDAGSPGLGLKLMQQGKGIIVVNKTSNPFGAEYQEQTLVGSGNTLQMQNVIDLAEISQKYDLESEGLSAIGLVVGSTKPCDGSIRAAFPGATHLNPGFGAQGGTFDKVMHELIPSGEFAGQGAIFSSSRGTLYPFLKKYGGSGDVANLENDLITAIGNFRNAEKEAFNDPDLKAKGIIYPFVA